jgi:hypothetical protein
MIVLGAAPVALGRLRLAIASRPPREQFVFCANRRIWL